ncbi:MAG: YveK family protein [Pseudonocardia sp.]
MIPRWVVPLAFVVLGAAGGFAYTQLVTPAYESKAYVIATAQATTTTTGAIPGDERRAIQVAQTLGRLVDQQEVVTAAGTAAGLTPDQVVRQVQGRTMPESSTIEIVGRGATPAGAADVVNAVADELVKLNADKMEATGVTLSVLSPASVPAEPSSPVLVLNLGVGAGAGILLGALYLLATGGSRRASAPAPSGPLPGVIGAGPPGARPGPPGQGYPPQRPPGPPPGYRPQGPGGPPNGRPGPPPPPPPRGAAVPPQYPGGRPR